MRIYLEIDFLHRAGAQTCEKTGQLLLCGGVSVYVCACVYIHMRAHGLTTIGASKVACSLMFLHSDIFLFFWHLFEMQLFIDSTYRLSSAALKSPVRKSQ